MGERYWPKAIFATAPGGTTDDWDLTGTAFVVAPGLVVTCWHCVRDVERGFTYSLATAPPTGSHEWSDITDLPLSNIEQHPAGVVADKEDCRGLAAVFLDANAVALGGTFALGCRRIAGVRTGKGGQPSCRTDCDDRR